ncbi:MAG TPA: hypothetical protein VFG69_21735 [Nannocystaceae bacterium]|nr:hypothetical protein [Nannocystaceae bacterium]
MAALQLVVATSLALGAASPAPLGSPWRVVAPRAPASDEPRSLRKPAVVDADVANDPRRSEAARAFADGEAAFDRGDFDDAAERFGRAHALSPHPWTLYNEAVSLRHAGRAVAAWRAFAELERTAADPQERAEAKREREALRGRVAIVELSGAAHTPACIDGDRIELAADGRARWIGAPGTHRLVTRAASVDFTANAGAAKRLDVVPPRRRAPRARGWLIAAIVGSVGGLAGGTAAAVLADRRGARIAAGVGAGAAATALVGSIVALVVVEREAKRRRPAPLPCELAR